MDSHKLLLAVAACNSVFNTWPTAISSNVSDDDLDDPTWRTYNRYLAIMSGVLDFAVRHFGLATNPASGVEYLETRESYKAILRPDELDALVEATVACEDADQRNATEPGAPWLATSGSAASAAKA
jgi:integrase